MLDHQKLFLNGLDTSWENAPCKMPGKIQNYTKSIDICPSILADIQPLYMLLICPPASIQLFSCLSSVSFSLHCFPLGCNFFLPFYILICLHIFLSLIFFCIGGGRGGGGYNHTSCHPMLSFVYPENCSDSVPSKKQILFFLKKVFSKGLVCSPNMLWSMHRKMENKKQQQIGLAGQKGWNLRVK